MGYTKRVLIKDVNGLLGELIGANKRLLKKMEIWSLDDFKDRIKDTHNTLFYVMGHEFYESLREMNDDGLLHLGLRNFDYSDFMQLDFVHIGDNRLIYDAAKEFYKYEADEGKVTKKWKFSHELVDENINNVRPRLDFFLSPLCEKVYLKYPHTKIVGLSEGKKVLERLDKYTVHKYDTATNYDWYRNPDKRVWENEFGFDFETFNSVKGAQLGKAFPEFVGVRCSGFALSYCDPYSEEPKAIFFDFRKDYGYDEREWENNPVYKKEYYEFLEVMKIFFDNHYKHVWAYNAAFEYAMLFNLLRKFYQIQDSYALCIADDHRGSLKFNTQLLLKSPSWDDELDADFEYFEQICGTFKSFEEFTEYEKTYQQLYEEGLESSSIKAEIKELNKKERELKKEICKQYGWKVKNNADEIQEKYEKTKLFKQQTALKEKYDFTVSIEKKDYRFKEAMVFFSRKNPGKRMLLEQHWGDQWGATGVLPNNTEYGTKEENCLGLYCGIDAFVGERLARLLMPAYGNNCYTEILNHRYIAAELKMSGIKVDKKRLLELYRFCWNVDNNYELSSNIFIQDLLGKQNINPFYLELYNTLNETQKFWLLKYPYYFKGGKDWAGAAFILEAYRQVYKKYSQAEVGNDYIPIKEIYELLGKTCTDEKAKGLIEEYNLESFTIFNFDEGDKKKDLSESSRNIHVEFRERIGNMALKYLKLGPIIRKINEFALDIFKDKYIHDFYDQTAIYWIYEKELPLARTKVQIGEYKSAPNFLSLFDHLDDTKKDAQIREKYFPEVTDEMLDNLRDLPEDLLEKFLNIVPIKSKDYIEKYIDKYSWEDWILESAEILGKDFANSLPSYYDFKHAMRDLSLEEKVCENVGDMNINIYESLRNTNGNRLIYPKELVMNYFSPEQIDEFYSYFVKNFNYYDYGLAIRSVALCFDLYVKYKGLDIDTNISKVDSKHLWNAMLEYLNNEEYRKLVIEDSNFTGKFAYTKDDSEELKEEYDWFGKIDPKTGFTKLDTKYNLDLWYNKDALEYCAKIYKVIPHLFNTKTGIYNFFKVDGRITPPIIDEVLSESQYDKDITKVQLKKLWDLIHQGFIRQLASTCHKLITTYIPAMDMGYVKKFYKENLNESGKDTVYGQWEYHEDYTLGTSKGRDESIVDKRGIDYLFSDDCENWFVNELPDLWCLPPYILNMVETKRNSSAFHTFRHYSDYMKCLTTNYDNYLKCYFDVL